jgi:hypothetical protein
MDKVYRPDRDGPKIAPTPETPSKDTRLPNTFRKTKPATPDIIQFDDSAVPVEVMTALIFEKVGAIELINISRSDLINGRDVSYSLISNTSVIDQTYNPQNLIRIPGSIEETFKNFGIRFATHVPSLGTGPLQYYIGALNSDPGCVGYPVLDKVTDALVACYTNYQTALSDLESISPPRDIVYSDPENGDIVVDVTNMKTNERVQIEILETGSVENGTIY